MVRLHLRFASDHPARRPSGDVSTHLVEYLVRRALREYWDLNDYSANLERIRRLMFAEHSELIEMAAMSGFTFSFDDDMELVLSVSDIDSAPNRIDSGSSRITEEFAYPEGSSSYVAKSISAGATLVSSQQDISSIYFVGGVFSAVPSVCFLSFFPHLFLLFSPLFPHFEVASQIQLRNLEERCELHPCVGKQHLQPPGIFAGH